MTLISFGSTFNSQKINGSSVINSKHNTERLMNDEGSSKDFPVFPNEQIGRSQVIKVKRYSPVEVKFTDLDKDFLSKSAQDAYSFGCNNEFGFYIASKNPETSIHGDDILTDKTNRHTMVNKIINKYDEIRAFKISGRDKFNEHASITVVKNDDSNMVTMYVCDSEKCSPVILDDNTDIKQFAPEIIEQLASLNALTVWKTPINITDSFQHIAHFYENLK